ncbi:MAG: DNA-binding phage protein [Myxococcota bacterium]
MQICEEVAGMDVDHDQVARELLLALRGQRSQVQWSRRLGYRSNVAYAWESGRRYPTAAETFRAIARSGIDADAAVTQFVGDRPDWLDEAPLDSPDGVARLLDDLRGSAGIGDLARRAGLSRYAVSRWLSGRTQPRLPDFLRVVDAASVRLPDFVAAIVDPACIPSLVDTWRRLEARRKGAGSHPWTQAILRAIELEDYLGLDRPPPGWIARRLGLDDETEAACLEFLEETGQVTWTGTHYKQEKLAVNLQRSSEVGRLLRMHWTHVAEERLAGGAEGQFSYNVFTVSREDFERIRQLHLDYFRALRAVVAESEPGEVVAVANVQLFPLEPPVDR